MLANKIAATPKLYSAVPHCTGSQEKFCRSNWLVQFYDAAKTAKKTFTLQTEHSKLNSFAKTLPLKLTSMLSKFKNKFRTNEAKNWQKMKNNQLQAKF